VQFPRFTIGCRKGSGQTIGRDIALPRSSQPATHDESRNANPQVPIFRLLFAMDPTRPDTGLTSH
jgi:hypothetical protein